MKQGQGILVRPFQEEDTQAVERLREKQGFSYEPPQWNDMAVGAVIEAQGIIRAAAFLRTTATAYLLLDSEQTKREKLGQLLILHQELYPAAKLGQITEVEAFLPPELEQKFGKLLAHLGWKKNLWPNFSLLVR